MVKTRHQVEPSDTEDDDFVTIPMRRTRRSQNHTPQLNGYDSGEESGPGADNGDDDYDGEVTVNRRGSQSTVRSLRAAAAASKARSAAALAGDSDGDDIPKKRVSGSPRKGRPRKVHVREPDPESSVDEDYDQESEIRRRATRSRRSLPPPVDADSSVDDEPEPTRPASSAVEVQRNYKHEPDQERVEERRTARSQESRRRSDIIGNERHQADSSFEEGIRRSTRQRKVMYDTYDQKLIDRHMALMADDESIYMTRRTRRSAEHVPREMPDRKAPKRKREAAMLAENGPNDEDMMEDMYTRVKRVRRQVKRDMYGMPINEDDDKNTEEEDTASSSSSSSSDTSDDDDNDDGEDEKQSNKSGPRSYYLREHKPSTNRYVAPSHEPKRTLRPRNMFRSSTPPRHRIKRTTYVSPAHRSPSRYRSRKRAAFHGESSTSSSDSSSGGDSADDERRFERRKVKSMAKAMNRCLPVNFKKDDMAQSTLRERNRIGSSLADVDPMNVDRSVSFSSVGGLGKHIQQLKEMIVFPLLYPEVFERFHIAPPRGVLFYGPPGTGKTLVARALANECSSPGRKVAFFMRKGADCLSKWVGESERQLRLLFDQAYQLRPSIIFFDEIDGLAPVRSSRQDQIHSSIVSTLLALMDGLDNRGEIVVIGATNRIDSIDPALRRPGRFDREFLFPLPSVTARQQILQIQTKEWKPKLCEPFLAELGEKTVGYCGADLKSLCTEAALHALRRRYPQIYQTNDKLEIDVQSIEVSVRDFQKALTNIVPTGQRSEIAPGRSLVASVRSLLSGTLESTLSLLRKTFPAALSQHSSVDLPVLNMPNQNSQNNPHPGNHNSADLEIYSDEDDDSPPIFESQPARGRARKSIDFEAIPKSYFDSVLSSFQLPLPHRPRLLLTGTPGQGQSTHLAPAIIHHLERLPVHNLDLPSLFGVSAKTPEEACSQVFREARRTSPSIIYLPHIEEWWDVITDTLRATFITLLNDLPSSTPLLLLATSNMHTASLPPLISRLFDSRLGEVVVMCNPTESERREFFQDILTQCKRPPPRRKKAAQRMLEVLPKAAAPEPRKLTDTELARLRKQEEATLRELRLFLRDVINKLGRDRKFGIFAKPVDIEEVSDYYEIIKSPMDLATMMAKIDLHEYQTVSEFLDDIELICNNALEYNPDTAPADRSIRHRACALRDTSQAIMVAELDEGFEKLCEEIKQARIKRGEEKSKHLPNYYFVKPKSTTAKKTVTLDQTPIDPDQTPENAKSEKRNTDEGVSGSGGGGDTKRELERDPRFPHLRRVVKRVRVTRTKNKKFQSPWCKPTRKIHKMVVVYIDESGQEVEPPLEDGEKEEKDKSSDESDDEENKDNSKSGESKAAKSPNNDEATDVKKVTRASLENNEQAKEKDVGDDGDDTPRSSVRTRRRTRSLIESDSEPMEVSTSPTAKSAATSPSRAGTSPGRAGNSPARANTPASAISTRGNPGRSPAASTPACADASSSEPKSQCNEAQTPAHQSPRARKSSVSSHDGKTVADSTEKSAEKPSDSNKNCASDTKEEEVESVPEKLPCPENSPIASRVTRSHMMQKAVAILEEKVEPVVIDEDRIRYLLARLVSVTSGYTVEELERIYSHLNQCIYAHRCHHDKGNLLQELESIINGLVRH